MEEGWMEGRGKQKKKEKISEKPIATHLCQ
jgi:hypothetical protein